MLLRIVIICRVVHEYMYMLMVLEKTFTKSLVVI